MPTRIKALYNIRGSLVPNEANYLPRGTILTMADDKVVQSWVARGLAVVYTPEMEAADKKSVEADVAKVAADESVKKARAEAAAA